MNIFLAAERDFMLDGVCNDGQHDPDLWFPQYKPIPGDDEGERICSECPVQDECFQYAMEHKIEGGTWGGVNEWDRRELLGRKKAPNGGKRGHPSVIDRVREKMTPEERHAFDAALADPDLPVRKLFWMTQKMTQKLGLDAVCESTVRRWARERRTGWKRSA